MRIILDTNVLLSAIALKNRLRPIFNKFMEGQYRLLLTTEIFFEYIEKLQITTSVTVAYNIGEILETLENVEYVSVSFNWNLITADEDDNKFVDCAIAGQADYLVTNDSHFNVIKENDFPFVKVISAEEFLQLLLSNE